MPSARMGTSAFFVLLEGLSCASADVEPPHDANVPPLFDAAFADATVDGAALDAGDERALDSVDARHTGLDERPRNATCLAPPGPESMPTRLRDTGCFDPNDVRRPAVGLIPYAVKAPLWSDGAAKERYLALPDGAKIAAAPDGDLDPPVGTVLIKTFLLQDTAVETRLFVRHSSTIWAGYSYAWNDDGTDAILLDADSVYRTVKGQEWQFPSRQHCLDCHTQAAGFSLGLEMAQLDRDFAYPNGRTANQLATWTAIGLFEETPPLATIATMPLPDDELAPIDQRARAYLHANCANCHRPTGVSEPNVIIDLRFTTHLENARICDEAPRRTDVGIPDVKLLAPGDPAKSMISFRMRSLVPSLRMPPMASSVPDAEGLHLVDSWIQTISSCPRVKED